MKNKQYERIISLLEDILEELKKHNETPDLPEVEVEQYPTWTPWNVSYTSNASNTAGAKVIWNKKDDDDDSSCACGGCKCK